MSAIPATSFSTYIPPISLVRDKPFDLRLTCIESKPLVESIIRYDTYCDVVDDRFLRTIVS